MSAGDTSVSLPLNDTEQISDVSSSVLSSDVDFMSVPHEYEKVHSHKDLLSNASISFNESPKEMLLGA